MDKYYVMTSSEMLEELGRYSAMVQNRLQRWIENSSFCVSPLLLKAMEHSLMAGGKRLRPALFLAWAESCGIEGESLVSFAAAIEMIHTYSLIHDDLPCMDDAALRRGQPSCHKKFGEAPALLAGDALLTDAFYLAAKTKANSDNLVQAIGVLALAAGSSGMVDGQVRDLSTTSVYGIGRSDLEILQAKKTGEMFSASCQCGVILGDGPEAQVKAATGYGVHLGAAFQIYDDVLDIIGDSEATGKPSGLDSANGRVTWPGMIGLEASFELARMEAARAIACLETTQEPQASFLRAVAEYAVTRKN